MPATPASPYAGEPSGSGTPQTPHPTTPASPSVGPGAPAEASRAGAAPDPSPRRRPAGPAEHASETTRRLRPVPAEPEPDRAPAPESAAAPRPAPRPADEAAAAPDPALSWSAPVAPGDGRPWVSFGEPEGYDGLARPRSLGGRGRPQAVAAAVCLVLGLGLVTGAVTGSWLAGDSGDGGARDAFAAAGDLWHSVPVDQLFPPTVQGRGAGPGGADRTWTRVAVAPDGDCAGAFDPLLAKVLDPVGCTRLLRATYTDATQSHVTTVGLLFAKADAAAMTALAGRFEKEGLGRRADLMPLPYAAEGTVAAGFGAPQRASWTVSVLTDAPVVVYAVSGWADDRTVDEPEPAEQALESGAASAPAQAGLGHEAQGLADRVERALRGNVGAPTEHPS
ncbi:hypothetical protein [Streptomyces sp. CB02414]|uniref:hypothetical protein n=1 Tax=Streptomyces sp. CB02414 TaxID=1703922 RepID=UPI001F51796D|nr:hypothetical protein [Streptomyces sp. CB02414]